jgi:hypothetical protein
LDDGIFFRRWCIVSLTAYIAKVWRDRADPHSSLLPPEDCGGPTSETLTSHLSYSSLPNSQLSQFGRPNTVVWTSICSPRFFLGQLFLCNNISKFYRENEQKLRSTLLDERNEID